MDPRQLPIRALHDSIVNALRDHGVQQWIGRVECLRAAVPEVQARLLDCLPIQEHPQVATPPSRRWATCPGAPSRASPLVRTERVDLPEREWPALFPSFVSFGHQRGQPETLLVHLGHRQTTSGSWPGSSSFRNRGLPTNGPQRRTPNIGLRTPNAATSALGHRFETVKASYDRR